MRQQMRIGPQLGDLESAGLIELASTQPELEYLFRHVLVQDAAYDSLLRQERRRLHRLVAETLEELNPSRRADLAPILAMHYEEAGDMERAHEHYVVAGEHAAQRFALHEAREFFTRAVALLPDADEPQVKRRRADLDLRRVQVGIDFVGADEQLAILADVERSALQLDDAHLLAATYLWMALERTERGEQYGASPELRRVLEQALSYADSADDRSLRAEAMGLLGEARFVSGEFATAIELIVEAVGVLDAEGHLRHASLFARTLALAYAQLGDFASALATVDRARDLATRSGDPTAILDADLAQSMIEALRGDPSTAIVYASNAAEQADRIDNKACGIVARSIIGDMRLLTAQPEAAIPVLAEVPDLAEYCNLVPSRVELSRVLLQSARSRAGEAPLRFDLHERGLDFARRTGDRSTEALLLRQRARDRVAAGLSVDEAVADYAAAAQVFERIGARPDLAHTLAEHGRLLSDSGRREEGRKLLERAARLFREMDLGAIAERTLSVEFTQR